MIIDNKSNLVEQKVKGISLTLPKYEHKTWIHTYRLPLLLHATVDTKLSCKLQN